MRADNWVSLVARIYTDVKVYYGIGDVKAYAFAILGGNDDCTTLPSGEGVFVVHEDGTEEWKDRNHIVFSDYYFALDNDPALKSRGWDEYYTWVGPGC